MLDGDLADHLAARRARRTQGQAHIVAGQVAGEQEIALGVVAVEHLLAGEVVQISGDLPFLAPFTIACPDTRTAEQYASIRTALELQGTPISEADLWIASAAGAARGTVVTNNVREFARVPNLPVEDWTLS